MNSDIDFSYSPPEVSKGADETLSNGHAKVFQYFKSRNHRFNHHKQSKFQVSLPLARIEQLHMAFLGREKLDGQFCVSNHHETVVT